jgi:hypothetical protein
LATLLTARETVSPRRTEGSANIHIHAKRDVHSIVFATVSQETNCVNAAGKAAARARWVAKAYREIFW